MFFRTSISSLLMLVLACASDFEPGTTLDQAALGTLEFERASALVLLPSATAELTVHHRNAQGLPVAGKQVEFSLTGGASGASLTPASALTNDQGVATTKLRVGSMQADLQVRASADDAAPDNIDVSVREGQATPLSVEVTYQGQRKLAAYTVTALNGKTCAQVRSQELTGELVYTVPATSAMVQFPLGTGLSIAVVAWGKDETGAKLARGCTDVVADATKARSPVVVELEDTQVSLERDLALELELNLVAPAARFTDLAKRAVDTTLAPSGSYAMFAEADYYLDAIAAQLALQSTSEALGQLSSLRTSTTLSASLNPALTKAGVGPKAVGARLGTLLAARGAALTLRTTYAAGKLTWTSGLSAMSADGMKALTLAIEPSATISASFDAGRAQLVIEELTLTLGLGAYGRTLLTALDRYDAMALQSMLDSASGCQDVVASWWAKSEAAALADPSIALAGCEQAVQKLRTAVETALSGLDDPHRAIQLRGSAQLYDRTDDGLVDDLAASELSGSWGPESVVAELRKPAKTSFAY